MRDIRKPSRSSKSNISNDISHTKKKIKEINQEVEKFEKNDYEDISYDKNGAPIMRASSHFDFKNLPNTKRIKRSETDLLDRNAFFNEKKRDFSDENIRKFKELKKKNKRSKKFLFYFFSFSLIAIFFAWTFLFDKVNIEVYPKYKDVEISDTFLLFKEDILMDYSSSTMSKNIMKSAPKEINEKAKGEITIYNNYSNASQTLIVNTRFQTKDGKIFRLDNSIIVPGKIGNIPGKIKAKVSADSYGAEYNISASEFTIPGFKGTARYAAFTGKSESPMKGGISGTIATVSPEDIAVANNELKGSINTNLSISFKKLSHDGYFSLYDSLIISYTDNQDILTSTDENNYKLIGNATLMSIKKEILSRLIAEKALKENFNALERVHIDDIKDLTFTIDPAANIDNGIIKVLINGKARIIWSYDSENIKSSLMGENIKNFDTIMDNYSNSIVDHTFSKSPFWIKTFPKNSSKIEIKEVLN